MVEDGSQRSDLDTHCHASLCLRGCENPLPAGQMPGTSCLDGILHSSPKQGHLLDSLGFKHCEKACGHILDYQTDKPCYPVSQVEGMVLEDCKNADLGIASFSDVKSHKSLDPVNELVFDYNFQPLDPDSEHRYSGQFGSSKPKRRIPKPIKQIKPVLMTLGKMCL